MCGFTSSRPEMEDRRDAGRGAGTGRSQWGLGFSRKTPQGSLQRPAVSSGPTKREERKSVLFLLREDGVPGMEV